MILLLRLVVINLTLLWLNLLVVGSDEIVDPDRTNLICELLNSTVTYSQEKAPLDISKLLPRIVEKVNSELKDVVDVEVLWGDMLSRVGKHSVQCSVTRLGKEIDEQDRGLKTQCFRVPFEILDTNECVLPVGQPMRHRCSYPSVCVNTLGSYECICPLRELKTPIDDGSDQTQWWEAIEKREHSPWDLSLDSSALSSCPSQVSTKGCCDELGHSEDGRLCRSRFQCPVDPCSSKISNDCVSKAKCKRKENPLEKPLYACQCPEDLMGNGHACREGVDSIPRPMVRYDGVTPTDETNRNGLFCGCHIPVIDVCDGFPKCEGKNEECAVSESKKPMCACKSGFVRIHSFGCVDETPPFLKLLNDPNNNGVNRLKQGDIYKEYAVDIIDDNAEDYLRSLKITYSRALPHGCLHEMGEFHVNYTVATPWTTPPYVRVTRTVLIEDIDECSLDVKEFEVRCPELVPVCDVVSGATCANSIGSYTCNCPKFTSGDGFQKMNSVGKNDKGKFIGAPHGYDGGGGCRDTSSPEIQVLGPNPKIFRSCQCRGLSGMMSALDQRNSYNRKDGDIAHDQKDFYEEDIKHMIKITSGAELCATHTNTKPSSLTCVKAIDYTHLGNVDLSSKVIVGDPIQISTLEWKVSYNVVDKAGNTASTQWRNVVVEEVELTDLEQKIRDEVLADRDLFTQKAINKALEIERKTKKQNEKNELSSCPSCDCQSADKSFSMKDCHNICRDEHYSTGCHSSDKTENIISYQQIIKESIEFVEQRIYPSFGIVIMICSIVAAVFFVIKRIFTAIVGNRGGWHYLNSADEEKEEEMLGQVTYFRSPNHPSRDRDPRMDASLNTQIPYKTSLSDDQRLDSHSNVRHHSSASGGIFSSPENRVRVDRKILSFSPTNSSDDAKKIFSPM